MELFLTHINVCLLSTSSAQKKSEPCKGKYVSLDIGIMYPAPKISNPNFNFKLCWREILPLPLRITSFWRQLGSSLGLEISRDSSGGLLFAFTCWGLLCFSFLGELHAYCCFGAFLYCQSLRGRGINIHQIFLIIHVIMIYLGVE